MLLEHKGGLLFVFFFFLTPSSHIHVQTLKLKSDAPQPPPFRWLSSKQWFSNFSHLGLTWENPFCNETSSPLLTLQAILVLGKPLLSAIKSVIERPALLQIVRYGVS